MSVAELVRVRGQKSHDFCYRKNQIAHGIQRPHSQFNAFRSNAEHPRSIAQW